MSRWHRRRNPSWTPWLYGSAVAVGAVVGAVFAWREGLRELALEVAPSLADLRLPRPDHILHLPESAEDHAILDSVICGCVEIVTPKIRVAEDGNVTELIDGVQLCAAKALDPEFPWPPMKGDHDSVQKLWTILGNEANRAIMSDRCQNSTSAPMAIPVAALRVGTTFHRPAISVRRK